MRSQLHTVVITALAALAIAACGGGSSSPRPPAPTVTLTSSATDVGVSVPSVTLTWSSTQAGSCEASDAWSGALGPSGSLKVDVQQTSTYTISCWGRGGMATASVTVRAWVPPRVVLTADPPSVLPNGTVLLTWSSQNATECRSFPSLPGMMPALPTSGSQMTAPLTDTTIFQIRCGNPIYPAGFAEVVVKVVLNFTVLELPMERAIDLNDAGDVVGNRRSAVVWQELVARLAGGTIQALACSTPPICARYWPVAMNAAKTVIGMEFAGSPMQWTGFRWQVGDAVVYSAGINSPQHIEDINDAGQIVGGGPVPGAMLISGGTSIRLFGTQGSNSMASAINNAGHITGYVVPGTDQIRHVFLYVDGTIQDLGTMNGASSDALDINLSDEIVGSADGHAFLYANSRFTDLGSLGGTESQATGINDAGQVVGTSTLAGADPQAQRAFLYVNGAMHDLNGLAAPLPAPLTEARKINNRGQIIANACPPPGTTGDCRAYLMTPESPP